MKIPKIKSLSKVKNAVIKKLGGYTAQDMFEERMIVYHNPKIVTEFQLAEINAKLKYTNLELHFMPEDKRERWIKDELFRRIAQQIGPYIEYAVGTPNPPTYEIVTAKARLRVMQPENGAELQHMPYPL